MRISLILATVGRTEELCFALGSIASQHKQPAEVIVVDQNPDDRLVPILQRAIEQGLLIRHLRCRPPGLSRARNVGLLAAVGDIIAFPDDDCWYEPETLSRAAHALQQQPDCDGLVAQWAEQTSALGAEAMEVNGSALSLAHWRAFRGGDASSISLFFRRELMQRVGPFDEDLGAGAWFGAAEETDLLLRALGLGAVLLRSTDVVVHHVCPQPGNLPASVDEVRRVVRRSRGTGALYAKHGLTPYVIARGLVGPVLRSCWPFGRRPPIVLALALVVGRMQGWWQWRRHRATQFQTRQ